MERYCLTGQSPQWAVAPMEEEEVNLYCRRRGNFVSPMLWGWEPDFKLEIQVTLKKCRTWPAALCTYIITIWHCTANNGKGQGAFHTCI